MNIFNKVTFKTLKINKIRTLVTIIGIILSASMITAVTTSVSSLQNFLIDVAISQDGDWHGAVYSVKGSDIDELREDPKVESYTWIQNIGYAELEDCKNDYMPYLFIAGMDETFKDAMPVKLIEGKIPESSTELILPRHLETNGGIKYSIGDVLTLDIGSRISDGFELNQRNAYLHIENGETEKLRVRDQHTFKVVGFYERPNFESFSSPGYTALTLSNNIGVDDYDVYIKAKKAKNIYSFLETRFLDKETETNLDLLMFSGASDDDSFNAVLYGLAGVLIVLIMFGSVLLIYNAFSISVSERTKQFGLLASIGATKKQILKSVLFEAFSLSIIGIPLGVLSGILGIAVTLKLTKNLSMSFLKYNTDVALELHVSPAAIVAAVLVALITVLISAYIPARCTVKLSAIDAIRQTDDIKVKARNLRTSKLTYRMFGFEGMIARKNFKRNRKKYRATVISLFMSVVLFISASSFCAYLSKGMDSVIEKVEYDLAYSFSPKQLENSTLEDFFKELTGISGVRESAYMYSPSQNNVEVPVSYLNKEYMDYYKNLYGKNNSDFLNGYASFGANIYFIDNDTYEKFLKKNSYDKEVYLNSDSPKAIVLDYTKFYNNAEGKYYTFHIFDDDDVESVDLKQTKEIENYYLAGKESDDEGNEFYIFRNANSEASEEELRLPFEEATEISNIKIGAVSETKPFCVNYHFGETITFLYPFSAITTVTGEDAENIWVQLYFKADDYKAVYNEMYTLIDEMDLAPERLYNAAENEEASRAMVTVVNIFMYGFIVLISLIALANVFNTISTNITLRRREFAMLKSVGMTEKGFDKMMKYECLLYGIKGLMYGLPVSFVVTYLIYRSVTQGWETKYFIPWYSVVIAIGSVFAVVFVTMVYSMRKIKKDNPIDALKNENI